MPEIVVEGVTGFLVDGPPGAVAALGRVTAIDRSVCRALATCRFGAQRMVAEYEAVYRSILP
jgi:hypothetical protein